jgi:hypothetical protein
MRADSQGQRSGSSSRRRVPLGDNTPHGGNGITNVCVFRENIPDSDQIRFFH